MEDTFSKTSEHVRLCVEQIIVPYLGMILLNCFSKMFKTVQFYCYIIIIIIIIRNDKDPPAVWISFKDRLQSQ